MQTNRSLPAWVLAGRWTMFPALGAAVALTAPRAGAWSLLFMCLLPVAALAASHRLERWAGLDRAAITLAALFGLYLTVNASWSVDPLEAYGKVGSYWAIVAATVVAIAGVGDLDDATLTRIGRALLAIIVLGAAYLMIEVLTNQAIKRALFTAIGASRVAGKHIHAEGNRITQINPYVLNRNMAMLQFLLWPALLLIWALVPRRRALALAAGLVGLAAVATFRSEHETSMLAMLFAAIVFAGMWVAPRAMRWVVVAGWVVATTLVVPLAYYSYKGGLHQAKWIPETGRNRIILWSFTANELRKAPVLGVGVASTKELDEQAAPTAIKPQDHTYPLRTGRHSHNIFMQTWYELGAVGAILLLAFGLAILRFLWRLAPAVQPFAFATFVASVLLGAFSWGMWQTWFMAGFGVSVLALTLAIAIARPAGGQASV